MSNHAVMILTVVAILAVGGMVLTGLAKTDAAAVARPIVGDECRIECPDGLEVAKIKQYNGYVYCACGQYERGQPPETVFEYELRHGRWIAR